MATRKTAIPRRRKPRYAYRLLIKLAESEPTIWRLVSVPGNYTMADLDRVIQAAMGWTNSHLHLFTVGDSQYGVPDEEWIDDLPVLPDEEFTLDRIGKLYKIEEEIRARKLTGENRHLHRFERARPVVEAFFNWVLTPRLWKQHFARQRLRSPVESLNA